MELTPEALPGGHQFTHGLENATRKCKDKVNRISNECRRMNVRFRDIEFDLEEDRSRCLYGLEPSEECDIKPADVRRVRDIFEQPVFFAKGVGAGQVVQGGHLEDCWLLAAFSAVNTVPTLLDRICVARDEKVGVYGFLFYMDEGWVDAVVDDQLYSNVPKYVELTDHERRLYKHNEELYDSIARKGSKTLYFAKSRHENETWIPLMEKAYAKVHGDYKCLRHGSSAEAMEDLTGGVSIRQHVRDILDEDEFWEQLLRVNEDRLFTCYIHGVTSNDGNDKSLVNGLITNHAYSIIKATEVKGKRFMKIRNPWGNTEWSGRWSDGSGEWSSEWMNVLPALGHEFGNDGEFIMQYEDFLKTFTMIGRTQIFDVSWSISSQWVIVHDKPFPRAWDYGEVSFSFNLTRQTPTVLALSRTNKRAFADIDGPYTWTYDFKLFRKGEQHALASSRSDVYYARTVPLEIDLEPGDYVVQVRLDRALTKTKSFWADAAENWNQRAFARKWALLAASRALAVNHRSTDYENLLVLPDGTFAGENLTDMELGIVPKRLRKPILPLATEALDDLAARTLALMSGASQSPDIDPVPTAEDSAAHGEDSSDLTASADTGKAETTETPAEDSVPTAAAKPGEYEAPLAEHESYWCDICETNPIKGPRYRCMDAACLYFDICQKCHDAKVHNQNHAFVRINTPKESKLLDMTPYKWEIPDDIVIGLRVYTKLDASTFVKAQLRHGRMIRWTDPRT